MSTMIEIGPSENKTYKVGRFTKDDGRVTLFLEGENWGPVVTGENEDAARKLFMKAFGVCLTLKNLYSVRQLFENDTLGKSRVTELTKRTKEEIDNLQFC